MELRSLGNSGLLVSQYSLGTMTWGRDTDIMRLEISSICITKQADVSLILPMFTVMAYLKKSSVN